MDTSYSTIFINGEPFNCFNFMSLYDLLIYLDFDVNRIVVEYNHRVIPSNQFNSTVVRNHDKLEVITIVGGG